MIDKGGAMPDASKATKAGTGIEALDRLLGGGLLTNRTTLVYGGPGCGKTLLGLQFLAAGALQHDEPGVFITFEERAEDVRRNTAGLGLGLEDLADDRLGLLEVRLPPDLVETGDYDIIGLLAGAEAKAKALGARRIVLDAVDVVLAMLDDPMAVRREVTRLNEWLRDTGLTGVVTAKADGADGTLGERYAFLEYMADAVIAVEQGIAGEVASRSLRVIKYRGADAATGKWPFIIGPDGLDVAGDAAVELRHKVSDERVSTGIERLDRMLGGGFFRASATLISGVSGTAKTTLAGAFAEAACRRGERVLFFSFDEGAEQIVRNLRSVGLDLGPHVETAKLRMTSARARPRSAEEHYVDMRRRLNEHGPTCLVVDSMTALAKAGDPIEAERVAQRLIDAAKEAGVTIVVTSLTASGGIPEEATPLEVSTIADTWLHLTYNVSGGERNRGVTVVKSRGTSHSNQVRELLLSDAGIDLADVYVAGGQVLMGTARIEKERAEAAAEASRKDEFERERRRRESEVAELRARIEALNHELEAKQADLAELDSGERERAERRSAGIHEVASMRRADP